MPKLKLCCLLMLLGLCFAACEEVIENPELLNAPPRIVIDAIVTDQVGKSYIILSTTDPFQSSTPTPRISGATVTLTDNSGTSYFFEESSEKGQYLPTDSTFRGVINQRYRLRVVVEGKAYSSTEVLHALPIIDSLSFEEKIDDLLLEDGYYVSIHLQEPASVENFYLWKVFVNNSLATENGLNVSSDIGIDGEYIRLEIPEPLQPQDTFKVELYSLSEDTYRYYLGLLQLTELGTPSQAVPENPVSNLTGEALGLFQVSALATSEVIIIPKQ